MNEAILPAAILVNNMRAEADPNVSLDMRVLADTLVSVEQIWSEQERGAGHSGRIMRKLVSAADRLGVTLKLTVRWLAYDPHDDDPDYDRLHDLNDKKLDNEQLEAWYARLGFVRTGDFDGDDPIMIRQPHNHSTLT